MSKMNCRSVRREIEEVAPGNLLSASAGDHLKDCPQCNAFREDRLKLREMLSSLGAVEVPADFDFRLRARLANEKRGAKQPFVMRNLFGVRSAAVAATLLLIGSALLFVSLRTSRNSQISANEMKNRSTAVDHSTRNKQPTDRSPTIVHPEQVATGFTEPKEKISTPGRIGYKRTEVASQGKAGVNPNLKTLEMSSSAAKVLRAGDPLKANVFPIGASFQSIKVSFDDGSGSSRTISVPSVSFGSQRVLSPGSSSLLASARSDW